MSGLAPWRRELRALIPRGFLRRDQGGQLLVSDYPRFPGAEEITARIRRAGYAVLIRERLAYLDGTEEKYEALLRPLLPAPDPAPGEDMPLLESLARRLCREDMSFRPCAALRIALKAWDAGDLSGLYAALAPEIARLQREKLPLPAAAGVLILAALNEGKGESPSC